MTDKEKLTALAEHWNAIERRVKQAEQVRGEVVIPAINELRYAGRKVIDAWLLYEKPISTTEDQNEFDETLAVIKQYLLNADHDVSDAVCFILHKEMQNFLRRYGEKTITKYFNDFPSFLARMKDVNNTVSQSRQTRMDRADKYEDIANNYIPALIGYYDQLLTSAELALEAELKQRYLNRCIIAFGTIGSLASIIALIYCLT